MTGMPIPLALPAMTPIGPIQPGAVAPGAVPLFQLPVAVVTDVEAASLSQLSELIDDQAERDAEVVVQPEAVRGERLVGLELVAVVANTTADRYGNIVPDMPGSKAAEPVGTGDATVSPHLLGRPPVSTRTVQPPGSATPPELARSNPDPSMRDGHVGAVNDREEVQPSAARDSRMAGEPATRLPSEVPDRRPLPPLPVAEGRSIDSRTPASVAGADAHPLQATVAAAEKFVPVVRDTQLVAATIRPAAIAAPVVRSIPVAVAGRAEKAAIDLQRTIAPDGEGITREPVAAFERSAVTERKSGLPARLLGSTRDFLVGPAVGSHASDIQVAVPDAKVDMPAEANSVRRPLPVAPTTGTRAGELLPDIERHPPDAPSSAPRLVTPRLIEKGMPPTSSSEAEALAMPSAVPPMPFAPIVSTGSVQLSAPIAPYPMQPAAALEIDPGGQWIDRLAVEISACAATGGARLRLSPDNLGELSISVRSTDDGAAVTIGTGDEGVRAMLQGAQDRLVSEARANGLRLSDVQTQLTGESNTDARQQSRHSAHGEMGRPEPAVPDNRPKRSDRPEFANHERRGSAGRWA